MAALQQRPDEFKRTSEPEAPPYNARSEVIDTMHRIGHVFIMIGAAPSRSVDIGDVDTSCLLRIVFMRTWPTKPAGLRYRFLCPGACAGRQLPLELKHFRKAGVSVASFRCNSDRSQRHVTTHGWNRDRQTAHG
jgi:hypothetical protein